MWSKAQAVGVVGGSRVCVCGGLCCPTCGAGRVMQQRFVCRDASAPAGSVSSRRELKGDLRRGGTLVPWRGECKLCVPGKTGLLVPPVPGGTCSPFLWHCGQLLLQVSCTCGGESPGEPLGQRLEQLGLAGAGAGMDY